MGGVFLPGPGQAIHIEGAPDTVAGQVFQVRIDPEPEVRFRPG
jgi:hypothetical protein